MRRVLLNNEKVDIPWRFIFIQKRAKKDNLFRMILFYKLVNDSLDLFLEFSFCNNLSAPFDQYYTLMGIIFK